jgi:hypothetical protein
MATPRRTPHPLKQELSACHHAPVKLVGGHGDFSDHEEGITMHYECTECHEPCDIAIKQEAVKEHLAKVGSKGGKAKAKAFEQVEKRRRKWLGKTGGQYQVTDLATPKPSATTDTAYPPGFVDRRFTIE